MKNLTWLQLSDAHLPPGSSDTYRVDKVLEALIATLKEEALRGRKPDIIFFTGDIAEKGKDYSKAEEFFDALLDATELLKQGKNEAKRRLFIVPGNHDVDRDKTTVLLRRTLDTPDEANDFFSPNSKEFRKIYFNRFHAYKKFFNRYFEGIRNINVEAHYYAEVLELNDIPIRLGIMGLNSAWFCQDKEDDHKLWIGERVCSEAFKSLAKKGGADLIFALYHHPHPCLHPEEICPIKGLLTAKADICLCGHLEQLETEQISDQHGKVLRFQSGAVYSNAQSPHRILWGIVDVQAGKVCIRPMTYQKGPLSIWALDTSLYPLEAPHYTKDFDLPRSLLRKSSSIVDASKKKSPSEAEELLNKYKSAYKKGNVSEALHFAEEAYENDPRNTLAVRRYCTCLLRYKRYGTLGKILDDIKKVEMYDDNIKMAEAEYLWRQLKYKEALGVLETIKDMNGYNVEYYKGICNLLSYIEENVQISHLLDAKKCLERASQLQPDGWWISLNLAITKILLGDKDEELELKTLVQLENAIKEYPLKASPRIYRLLYAVINDDFDKLKEIIDRDHKECQNKPFEVPTDLIHTVFARIYFIFGGDNAKKQMYLREITRWVSKFSTLHF